jgi:8-oxo-dGTP diphosphatase
MERISRLGVYGILVKDSQILLALKASGPYQGLWDLPGGGVEFGETPEETLTRELREEVALEGERHEFLYHSTNTGEYLKENLPYAFHHIGLIYRVFNEKTLPDVIPEEEHQWFPIESIVFENLTPFARQAISHLCKK